MTTAELRLLTFKIALWLGRRIPFVAGFVAWSWVYYGLRPDPIALAIAVVVSCWLGIGMGARTVADYVAPVLAESRAISAKQAAALRSVRDQVQALIDRGRQP